MGSGASSSKLYRRDAGLKHAAASDRAVEARSPFARKLRPEGSHAAAQIDNSGMILAADVGGTNSRLMLYRVEMDAPIERKREAPGTLLLVQKYSNIRYGSFTDVVKQFLQDVEGSPDIVAAGSRLKLDVACLAVAGVALRNRARLTNLDWIIDGAELEERFDIDCVEVINDFVAQGYGVLTLGDDEVTQISGPAPTPGDVVACVGAGTGLGQCYLTAGEDGDYRCQPSEGGHAEFAPRGAGCDDTQIQLLRHLKIKFSAWNRISFERVVSGKGICNIYEFLAYREPKRVDKEVHAEFLTRPNDASIIAKNAAAGSLCEETLQLFADAYGAVCGTFALQTMPFGGLYLTGGVTQRLAGFLQKDPSFFEAFLDKGRVATMLQDVPVLLVNGDEMGQRGAHLRAVRLLHEHRKLGEQHVRAKSRPVNTAALPPPRSVAFADVYKSALGMLHGASSKELVSEGQSK
eukprot:TRINITY_DN36637_c0_g2_i1.p1 TRINITY_DN36637_c0_g2~~TRINITY_DN36637_c0_g2_i1.p1  ORF type:complete len:463 (-),score=100.24 TRINITY_DN36637_c0_g2_i1:153-1541(-)